MKITVYGEPRGKARPRVVVRGNSSHAYTPKPTMEYENRIKQVFYEARHEKIEDGAVSVHIMAYMGIPKSATKAKREQMISGDILPTKKPDCDNIAKIVLDALNGIAYKDDSQVCVLIAEKYYSEEPRMVINILRESL